MKRVLKVQKLTAENFAPYGQVVEYKTLQPAAVEKEYTFWNNLAQLSIEGKVDFCILEVVKRERTFSKIERHIRTEEAFFALDGDNIILTAQPTPGEKFPDPETVAAFYLEQGKGVIFKQGAWHWLPFPLKEKNTLLILCRQGTSDGDLEIVDMQDQGVTFEIDLG